MVRSAEALRRDVVEQKATLATHPWYVRPLANQKSLGYEAGDTNLYRYIHNGPLTATDPTGLQADKAKQFTLSHETAVGPHGGMYGAFIWGVVWKIDPAADTTRGGMVVQRVRLEYRITDSATGGRVSHPKIDGSVATSRKEWYEAWRIEPGQSVATPFVLPQGFDQETANTYGLPYETFRDPVKGVMKPIEANDWYYSLEPSINPDRGGPKTSGTIRVIGEAVYYDCMRPADLANKNHGDFRVRKVPGAISLQATPAADGDGAKAAQFLGAWSQGKSAPIPHVLLAEWATDGQTVVVGY